MKSIVLIGMMGCGKSTCGRRLAKRYGRELVDTDAVVESQAGKSIPDIFAQEGEAAFRDWETAVCRSLAGKEDLVIATGGGLVLRSENVTFLKENGVLVFLNRPVERILRSTSMAGRPLAQAGERAFIERFHQREPCYRSCADVEIRDFSSIEATVSEILRKLEGKL